MARTAYVMDRYMHWMGLHGKSCMPMLLGFGCNVPAVLGTRIIEDRKARMLTMLLTPFIPCTGRLAVLAFLAPAFFGADGALGGGRPGGRQPSAVGPGGYGSQPAGLQGGAQRLHHGDAAVPRAQRPHHRAVRVAQHHGPSSRRRARSSSSCRPSIWVLSNYPGSDPSGSVLGSAGRFLEPVGALLGLGDWRLIVALISSFVAKENSVAALGILFGSGAVGGDGRRSGPGGQGGGCADSGRRRRVPGGADDLHPLRGYRGRHPARIAFVAVDRRQRGAHAGGVVRPWAAGVPGRVASLAGRWSLHDRKQARFCILPCIQRSKAGMRSREAPMQIYVDGEFLQRRRREGQRLRPRSSVRGRGVRRHPHVRRQGIRTRRAHRPAVRLGADPSSRHPSVPQRTGRGLDGDSCGAMTFRHISVWWSRGARATWGSTPASAPRPRSSSSPAASRSIRARSMRTAFGSRHWLRGATTRRPSTRP